MSRHPSQRPNPLLRIELHGPDGSVQGRDYELKSAVEVADFIINCASKLRADVGDAAYMKLCRALRDKHREWKRFEMARCNGSFNAVYVGRNAGVDA